MKGMAAHTSCVCVCVRERETHNRPSDVSMLLYRIAFQIRLVYIRLVYISNCIPSMYTNLICVT